MVCINEQALQNLSLIVNLAKMIQIKSAESIDDTKGYFPSFLWILRDASLQMKDKQGNELSTKRYLERSL